jgi:hypothetical protein
MEFVSINLIFYDIDPFSPFMQGKLMVLDVNYRQQPHHFNLTRRSYTLWMESLYPTLTSNSHNSANLR